MMEEIKTSFKLSRGIYFLIDPSFILDTETFNSLIKFNHKITKDKIVKLDFLLGRQMYVVKTAYGAGCFPYYKRFHKNKAIRFCIDSGYMSLVTKKMITDDITLDRIAIIDYKVSITTCHHKPFTLSIHDLGNISHNYLNHIFKFR